MLFHEGYWSFKIHWIYLLCVWRPKIRIFDIGKKKQKCRLRQNKNFVCGLVFVPNPFYYKTTIRTFLLLKISINQRNIEVIFPLIQKNFPLEGSTNIYFTIGKTMLFNSAMSHAQDLFKDMSWTL